MEELGERQERGRKRDREGRRERGRERGKKREGERGRELSM